MTLGSSVASVGFCAFQNCSGLTSITLPNSVTSIGDYAFYDCSGLTSVVFPNSVISIGNNAFCYCSGLTSVVIPNLVTSIGESAFYGCSGLTSIMLGSSVASIGDYAFYYCNGLTSVTIPESVISIGDKAFSNSSGLTMINVENGNNHYKSIDGVLFDFEATTLIQYPMGNSRVAYIIPNSVISIGNYAFWGCNGLTSVTIPESVISIGDKAFSNSFRLTTINVENGNNHYKSIDGVLFDFEATTLIQYPMGNSRTTYIIPESVISIEDDAFLSSYRLTSVTIPESVTSIGEQAFSGCFGLQKVINYAKEPQQILSNVFENVGLSDVQLFVPSLSVDKYRTAEVWRDFGAIKDVESGINAVEVGDIIVSGGMLHNPAGKEIRIYDLNGREVYSGNDNELRFPDGFYILQTSSGNRKVAF